MSDLTVSEARLYIETHLADYIAKKYDTTSEYAANKAIERVDALLSVVAAEEGRKYAELAKLVKEWQEAYEPFKHLPRPPVMTEQISRILNAESALAQWEAL